MALFLWVAWISPAWGSSTYPDIRQQILILKAQQIDNVDLVLLGDSITDAMFLPSLPGKKVTVFNAGIGSAGVGTVLAMAEKLLPRFHKATFFIHIGINDCIRDGETTLAAFEEIFKKILNILAGQSAKVIISDYACGQKLELGRPIL